MNWKIINKSEAPIKGKFYWDWKDFLADEGYNHCVYCTIHESSFGRRNFHVEHYKPKSIPEFQCLSHEHSNLFFACCICNCFKGSYWVDPKNDFSNCSFPDPSKVDYNDLFFLKNDATLTGKNISGEFIIHKLYLNRPQLILYRKQQLLDIRLKTLIDFFIETKEKVKIKINEGNHEGLGYLVSILDSYEKLLQLQLQIKKTIPYTSNDIKKK